MLRRWEGYFKDLSNLNDICSITGCDKYSFHSLDFLPYCRGLLGGRPVLGSTRVNSGRSIALKFTGQCCVSEGAGKETLLLGQLHTLYLLIDFHSPPILPPLRDLQSSWVLCCAHDAYLDICLSVSFFIASLDGISGGHQPSFSRGAPLMKLVFHQSNSGGWWKPSFGEWWMKETLVASCFFFCFIFRKKKRGGGVVGLSLFG